MPTPPRYRSALLQRLQPYTPGEQSDDPDVVKLNTNECPYGPVPEVIAAVQAAAGDSLRLYPDPQSSALRAAIAGHHGLSIEQVFVGNGSDEVLAFAFLALLNHGAPLRFPDVTYGFYPAYCHLFGIPYRTVPLDEHFRIRVADYAGACGGVVIANPNALTGIALDLDEVDALLRIQARRVVVVDEAYVDFGAQSAVALLRSRPNLLVVRTLSKSRGLAGLRVGYALGAPALVQALSLVKDSFNAYPLDRLAQAGAAAAIAADEHARQVCHRIAADRDALSTRLTALGFGVLPSKANFVFATHGAMAAETIAARLRERAILVRHFRQPRVDRFLRISIGTEAAHDKLVRALQDVLCA